MPVSNSPVQGTLKAGLAGLLGLLQGTATDESYRKANRELKRRVIEGTPFQRKATEKRD
jgi:hypothetical protein